MEFNNKGFQSFRDDVKEALKSVAEKHQVKIEDKGISYSEFDFKIKLCVTKKEEGFDGEFEKFKQICFLYGFEVDDYKKAFTLEGRQFYLTGFNEKRPKNCCSIYCLSDGKQYACSAETVQRSLVSEKSLNKSKNIEQ